MCVCFFSWLFNANPLFVHLTNTAQPPSRHRPRDVLHALWSANSSVVRLMNFAEYSWIVCNLDVCYFSWMRARTRSRFWLNFIRIDCGRNLADKNHNVWVCFYFVIGFVQSFQVTFSYFFSLSLCNLLIPNMLKYMILTRTHNLLNSINRIEVFRI